jgi:aquaporin Z
MATRKSPSRTGSARRTSTARTADTRVTETPVETVATVEAVEYSAERPGFYNRFPVAALIAEFLGTFAFVAFSVVTQINPLYAFFGLIGIVALFGRLSGPHLNPAISIGAWLSRFISGRTALFYVVAQILGGFAAFGILSLFNLSATTTDQYTGAATAANLYSLPVLTASHQWVTFAAELIGAIILGYGVATALSRRSTAVRAIAYAGSALVASFIVYATGAFGVFNPVLAGGLKAYSHIDWATFNLFPVLVYAIAPIIGASLGFGLYRLLQRATVTE